MGPARTRNLTYAIIRPRRLSMLTWSWLARALPARLRRPTWLAVVCASRLLEKSTFPREKVCGDGLTPRGTRQLIRLGIDTSEEAGWLHNKGLRIYGGERPFELEWPALADFPRVRPGSAAR